MNDLLSRYAECLYWFGRYTERTACLARILEVQTSFTRGKPDHEADWAWIIKLYDDEDEFAKLFETPDASSVANFYVADARNPSSLLSSIKAARENARTLRALISTDLWMQVNAFYNRFRNLHAASFATTQLSATCRMVKKECYAQLGVAESTLYRDPAWHFFMTGLLIERADQMSRLLDVRFAQATRGVQHLEDPLGDFSLWSVLLRSAAAHQTYVRVTGGRRNPEAVARFFIFNTEFPRSIAFCVMELDKIANDLRSQYAMRGIIPILAEIDALGHLLNTANDDPGLVGNLHNFNDKIQIELARIGAELSYGFFSVQRPDVPERPDQVSAHSGSPGSGASQSQSQS